MKKHEVHKAFEEYSYAQWEVEVLKRSKIQDISDLIWQIDDHISIMPLQPEQDSVIVPMNLNIHSSWQIGQNIPIDRNLEDINILLHSALSSGLNAPKIEILTSLSMSDFDILFKEVLVDYIFLVFIFQDNKVMEDTLTEWDQYLTTRNVNSSTNQLRIEYTEDQKEVIPIFKKFGSLYPEWKFFTFFEEKIAEDKSKTKSSYKILQDTINWYVSSGLDDKAFAKISWHLQSSMNYLIEVARLRALKWCWKLTLESLQIQKTPYPFMDWEVPCQSEEDQELIRSTIQCMSGIQGGVDRIFIKSLNAYSDYDRLARNIQNILQLESKLDKIEDPVKGSYFLEALTQKIGKKIWEDIRF